MLLQSRARLSSYVASGRERLEMLASFVETLPPERLTLTRWYGFGKGCAVGWAAATHPWFQAQGLKLGDVENLVACRPEFGQKSDWAAVASFFEITPAEAQALFGPGGHGGALRPHPVRMADAIRAFLAQRTAA